VPDGGDREVAYEAWRSLSNEGTSFLNRLIQIWLSMRIALLQGSSPIKSWLRMTNLKRFYYVLKESVK
jgi:hypothetical protein